MFVLFPVVRWRRHRPTKKENNEEAEMGDGWRVLGRGCVNAGDPWRRSPPCSWGPTPFGDFSWAQVFSSQADWFLPALHVYAFSPLLFPLWSCRPFSSTRLLSLSRNLVRSPSPIDLNWAFLYSSLADCEISHMILEFCQFYSSMFPFHYQPLCRTCRKKWIVLIMIRGILGVAKSEETNLFIFWMWFLSVYSTWLY